MLTLMCELAVFLVILIPMTGADAFVLNPQGPAAYGARGSGALLRVADAGAGDAVAPLPKLLGAA